MKKEIKHFIGIDASKLTFDSILLNDGQQTAPLHWMFKNTAKDVKKMLQLLVSHKVNLDEAVFCMEHTGLYSHVIAEALVKNHCLVWLEMPMVIIRSMGLQRGKNDKMDALKIALFAYKNRENIKVWNPSREEIIRMKDMLSLRERLVKMITGISAPMKELKDVGQKKRSNHLRMLCKQSLIAFRSDIARIEKELEELVENDDRLSDLFGLLTSIPGIGKVTAWYFIVTTNEFVSFKSAKKLACNVGVVPFEHQSGTSVRGKSRVSKMANKQIKKLLHLGALSLIKKDNEFKHYYDRKVAEGKNKMLVLNAIRNKLVHRVMAVVTRGTPYQINYQYAA
jgi:transposase